MTSRLGYKSEKTSSASRFLFVKESYNFVHYTQLSFDDQTKMFISVTPLIIPLQKFQHAHWLRTRQCFSNNAKS